VQAAINAAGPNLPKDLPQPPVYWKANPSGFALSALAMTSDIVAPSDLYDYADSVVAEKISQLAGVARVTVSGAERSAVRIQVQPRQLANMKLSLEDLREAIKDATQNLPKARLPRAMSATPSPPTTNWSRQRITRISWWPIAAGRRRGCAMWPMSRTASSTTSWRAGWATGAPW
jgi:multidrug efflux pump subunit AcrB